MRMVTALLLLALLGTAAPAQQLDNSRYPYRIPEWLWQDEARSGLLGEQTRRELEADLKNIEALYLLKKESEASNREQLLSKRLAASFSLRELGHGAEIFREPTSGLTIAVHFDPTLPKHILEPLRSSIPIILKYAFDDGIIDQALKMSVARPAPFPAMYEMKDRSPQVDGLGNKILTSDYKLYLRSIAKPADVASFKLHLSSAIKNTGDAPLLIISRYSGNVWWGGGYYDFFNSAEQRLSRNLPSQGLLYIRLNSDKMSASSPNWNEPAFWASKIVHEILHNLGYWHPSYNDPEERDRNNVGNTRSFMVAYESLLLEKARNDNR